MKFNIECLDQDVLSVIKKYSYVNIFVQNINVIGILLKVALRKKSFK